MYSRHADIEMSSCRNAHRIESSRRFQSNRDVGRSSRNDWHEWHNPLRAGIADSHARFRVDGRQIAEDLHLLCAQPRRHAKLRRVLEDLTKMRGCLPRTINHFRNSGARLAIDVPPNLRHDATKGSETLPLWSPPKSSATNLKPAFLQARRSSWRSGSVTTRSNISAGISRPATPSCPRARAGQVWWRRGNFSTASICASRSGVTSTPTGTLLARHGAAGFSAFDRFHRRARARTSDLLNPASTSGAMTPRSIAA